MKYTGLLIAISAAAFLGACSDSSNYDHAASRAEAVEAAAQLPATTFEARFDPANSVIPFPNNPLFTGSTDGTLNIPVDDESNFSNPQVALNALDGFSTTAPITASFSQEIATSSVILGDTVRVFKVTTDPATGAVVAVESELNLPQIAVAVAGEDNDTIAILPLNPLEESSTYLVVLTNGITNTAETPVGADKSLSYHLASGSEVLTDALEALEPVRQLTSTFEAAAVSQGITESAIVLSWTFTTQSITPVMDAVIGLATSGDIVIGPAATPSSAFNPALDGSANIHFGSLTVPYYLLAPTAENPTQTINSFWKSTNGGFLTRFDTVPAETSKQTIPLLLSLPNIEGMPVPDAGWPVAIFQHGITQERSNMLAIADTMAKAGIAVIAIDLPMHGITDTTSPLYAGSAALAALGATERTFDLDFVNNETQASGSDGIIDSSGSYYINLKNLLNSRDNLRQAISDLATLRRSIPDINAAFQLDANTLSFIGHSLGGITGTVFMANDTEVGPATIAMAGGGIARLLSNSPAFAPAINAGLASQGVIEGTANYEAFLTAAQTAVDSGDPINFSATAALQHPTLFFEIIGGSGGSLPDQVIPNTVATAPLSGTEPMISLMGLDAIVATTGPGVAPVSGAVRFISGGHSSILSPEADPLVTKEMQTQMARFTASRGTWISIDNPDVISTGN